MSRREELLRDIDLHRHAVAGHIKKSNPWAAAAAQACLERKELELKQLNELKVTL